VLELVPLAGEEPGDRPDPSRSGRLLVTAAKLDELLDRLDAIERRLDAIERRLGLGEPPAEAEPG
jgi:hypothetical protein